MPFWMALGFCCSITVLTAGDQAVSTQGEIGPDGQGRWVTIEACPPCPSPRSAPVVAARRTGVSSRDKVWLFSGVFDDFSTGVNTFLNDLWRWDATLKKWTLLTPTGGPPPARAFAAAAFHERTLRVVVFGGSQFGDTGLQTFDDLWAYSTTGNRWTRLLSPTPGPVARSGPGMWIVGEKLYVFGGITSGFEFLNDLWTYDFTTNAWTLLIPNGAPGSPPPRHVPQADSIAVAGTLTLYGGEVLDELGEFAILADTWEFDTILGRWRNVAPPLDRDIQPPRNYAAAAIFGNTLILQGGDLPGGTEGCGAPFPLNVTEELWRFNLTSKVWRRLHPGGDPLARLKRHAAASLPDAIFYFTGWDFQCDNGVGAGQIFNQKVYAYIPPR